MITDIGGRYGIAPTITVAGALTAARGVDAAQARGDAVRLNLIGNITNVTIVNGMAGMRLVVILVQDATGSRTATWNSTVKFVGGSAPPLTAAALHADVLEFFCYDGTNWFELGRSLDIGVPVATPAAD